MGNISFNNNKPSQRGNNIRNIKIKSRIKGLSLSFDAKESDTIKSIKDKIQIEDGVPPEFQTLEFNSQRLDDDKTLSDYNITEDSTLFLRCKFSNVGMTNTNLSDTTFKIHINSRIKGLSLSFDVKDSDTIRSIKDRINKENGIPLECQTLEFKFQTLENDMTLEYYNITKGSTLILKCRLFLLD